jgi:hypothetical protein
LPSGKGIVTVLRVFHLSLLDFNAGLQPNLTCPKHVRYMGRSFTLLNQHTASLKWLNLWFNYPPRLSFV